MYQCERLDSGNKLYTHQAVRFEGNRLVADAALEVYFCAEGEPASDSYFETVAPGLWNLQEVCRILE